MTPSQNEAAARIYLQSVNQDPDEMCRLSKPLVGPNGPIEQMARWKFVAPALLDQWRLMEAIRLATALQQTGVTG